VRNNDFTKVTLAEVAEHIGTTEHAIIRELCALYDHFCNCPAVAEQRIYVKKRIQHYKEILQNERNA
jgi:transcriptional regulator of NAD metabolism